MPTRRVSIILVTCLGISLLLLACGSSSKRPAAAQMGQSVSSLSQSASGTQTPPTTAPKQGTYAFNGTVSAPECGGGYDLPNAHVTVRNESNRIIATAIATPDITTLTGLSTLAKLETQFASAEKADYKSLASTGYEQPEETQVQDQIDNFLKTFRCVVHFSVAVPRARFYQWKVGGFHIPAASFAELQANASRGDTAGLAQAIFLTRPSDPTELGIDAQLSKVMQLDDQAATALVEGERKVATATHALALDYLPTTAP